MNSNNIINSLFNLSEKQDNAVQKVTKKSILGKKNDRETRGENKRVNQSILRNTMQEWTTVVDDATVVNNTAICKIDVSKPGVTKNAWQIHKEYLLKDDSMAGEMMRILCAGDEKNSCKSNPEDEYKSSIARLQQERANRMHHEQMMSKGRMNKKIKSKGFHRHAKRRDLKEFLKKEENNENNEDNMKEKLSQFEKIRAQERMSLRHKTGGKFAKIQKLRAKYDANAREALDGMREKGKELTRKMNDEEESEEESENDDDNEEKESEMSEEEEEIDDGENEDESGEEQERRGEEEELVSTGRSGEMANSSRHKTKSFVEKIGGENCEIARKAEKVSSALSTNESSFLMNYDAMELEEGEELVGSDEARFKSAIYDFYQQDSDLAAEFEREKNELVEKENPKDVELFKPGWGAWTGAGFEAADKRRRQRGLIKAPDANRRDKRKTRVWIKQGVHDGLKKHLIKAIPFPYNTAEQFDLSRKELISSTFTLQTVHRELVKPKFVNKAGQHIYPRNKLEKKIN